jgi:cytochrome d ubiquinol oxidase subunit II
MTMLDLPTVWFLLVGVLLAGYAILDGFDLGVGMLHLFVARNDQERRIVLNSIGPVWDGNEVWLLTAGGALFAAFPGVYATVFSGMYLAFMLLLAALITRAVSMEFRSKEPGAVWRRFWDGAFAVASLLAALLCGFALGNVLLGLPLDADSDSTGTFLGLLNPFALAVGLLGVSMFVVQGAVWLQLKTEHVIQARARRAAVIGSCVFLVSWIGVTVLSRFAAPHLWRAYAHPAAWFAPAALVVSAAAFGWALATGRRGLAFTFSSTAIAMLLAITGQGLYPFLVPAQGSLHTGLTVYNASSSPLTLRTLLVIALVGMGAVVGYAVVV